MIEILKQAFSSVFLFFIAAPLIGWALLNCIWELADGFGIVLKKDRKFKCWIYLSLIVFLLTIIVKVFSS